MRAGDAWQGPWMEARRRRTGSPDRAPERVLAAQRILYATGHTEPAALERRPVIGDSKTAGQNVTSSSGLARRGGRPLRTALGGGVLAAVPGPTSLRLARWLAGGMPPAIDTGYTRRRAIV